MRSNNSFTPKLHWTDQPYKWHRNDGEEVFAVLDGRVEMRFRENGSEHSAILEAGDIFHASLAIEPNAIFEGAVKHAQDPMAEGVVSTPLAMNPTRWSGVGLAIVSESSGE